MHDQADDEENDEDVEQYFGYPGRGSSDDPKAQNSSDDGDDEKNQGVIEHAAVSFGIRRGTVPLGSSSPLVGPSIRLGTVSNLSWSCHRGQFGELRISFTYVHGSPSESEMRRGLRRWSPHHHQGNSFVKA